MGGRKAEELSSFEGGRREEGLTTIESSFGKGQ